MGLPSPKSQVHDVGLPVEVSANCILWPLTGVAVKLATGAVEFWQVLGPGGAITSPLVNVEAQPVVRSVTVTVIGVGAFCVPPLPHDWVLKVKPCGGFGTITLMVVAVPPVTWAELPLLPLPKVTPMFCGVKSRPWMVTGLPTPPLFGLRPVMV